MCTRGIEVAATDPVSVLRIHGAYGVDDFNHLSTTLASALMEAATRVVVCEVSELEVITPELLCAFPAALRMSGGWPTVSLHLAGLPASLGMWLQAKQLHRFLSIHRSLSAAIIASYPETVVDVRSLALQADPAQLRLVRGLAEAMWPALQSMPLVAGELAANAIHHVGEPFTLSFVTTTTRALVAATDCSRCLPASQKNGYGMHLIHSMSQDWGVRWVYPSGKTVWAAMVL